VTTPTESPVCEQYPVPVDSDRFSGCDPIWFNKFRDYHFRNPATFLRFMEYTDMLLAAGADASSSWLVINRMRWDAVVQRDEAFQFAINNDFNALYSRLAMHHFPRCRGFFKTCKLKWRKYRTASDVREYQGAWEDRHAALTNVRLPVYHQRFYVPVHDENPVCQPGEQ